MQNSGQAAFERRVEEKSRVYAYEQAEAADFSREEWQQLRDDEAAWRFFETTPPGYRKVVLHWITGAKKAETRANRFAKLVAACTRGERLR